MLPPLRSALAVLRARLIADWRRAHRFWSVRLSTVGAALMAAWTALPADLRAALPLAHQLAAGLFVAILLSRLVAQEEKR